MSTRPPTSHKFPPQPATLITHNPTVSERESTLKDLGFDLDPNKDQNISTWLGLSICVVSFLFSIISLQGITDCTVYVSRCDECTDTSRAFFFFFFFLIQLKWGCEFTFPPFSDSKKRCTAAQPENVTQIPLKSAPGSFPSHSGVKRS